MMHMQMPQSDDNPEPDYDEENGNRRGMELKLRNRPVAEQYDTISANFLRTLPSHDPNTVYNDQYDESLANGFFGTSQRHRGRDTIRLRNINPSVFNQLDESRVADILINDADVNDMGFDEAERLQGKTLRDMHYCLTKKRKIKKRLSLRNMEGKRLQKNISCWKQMKYSISMKRQHLKSAFKDFLENLQLWEKHMRTIEGNFGSGVASHFHFLRRLVGLNSLHLIIILLFTLTPQMLTKVFSASLQPYTGCHNSSYLSNFDTNKLRLNFNKFQENETFTGVELITGAGSFRNTLLYYGAYNHLVLSITSNTYYNIPLAYILSVGIGLTLLLIIIAHSLAKSYKVNYIDHRGFGFNYFSNKVFSGWDFAIRSKKAAQLHSRSLLQELQEHLEGAKEKPKYSSTGDKIASWGQLFAFNIFALAILIGVGALMYYLMDYKYLKPEIKFLNEMSLALTVSVITIIVPALFALISHYEGHKTRQSQLRITMIRSLLLIAVVLGMLLYFWIKPTDNDKNKLETICWETELGMEIYRLMMVDFFVCVILYSIMCGIRKLVFKDKNFEFNPSWHTWNLLYNQMLCWIGVYFCPLIPAILIIKLILIFYIKKLCVLHSCSPPTHVWRANRAETVFLGITFLGIVLSMAAIGYIIIRKNSSDICGPFSMYVKPYDIVLCISESFETGKQWLGMLAVFITKPGFVAVIIIMLCCITYCVRANAKAMLKMITLLREQVALEGRDKTYLLAMYVRVLEEYSRNNRETLRDESGIQQANLAQLASNNEHATSSQPTYGPSTSTSQQQQYYSPKTDYDNSFEEKSNMSFQRNPTLSPNVYGSREGLAHGTGMQASGQFIGPNQSASQQQQYYPPKTNYDSSFKEESNRSFQRTPTMSTNVYSSSEGLAHGTGMQVSPTRGAENQGFYKDSPYKAEMKPYKYMHKKY